MFGGVIAEPNVNIVAAFPERGDVINRDAHFTRYHSGGRKNKTMLKL
jgi:hypothetical protein